LDFVSTLVSATIWPVVVILLVIILRRPLVDLMPRVREAEGFGVKAKFADRIQDVAEKAEAARIPTLSYHPSGVPSDADEGFLATIESVLEEGWREAKEEMAPAQELAASQPRVAILSASRSLSNRLIILQAADMKANPNARQGAAAGDVDAVRHLLSRGILAESAVNVIEELMGIAKAVRDERTLDATSASNYVFACTEVVFPLIALARSYEYDNQADRPGK
jgi:hypothetical protein